MTATASLSLTFLPVLAEALDEPAGAAEAGPAPAPTDQALLEGVSRGDQDAFAVLYGRYERPVFGVLLRMAGRRALAEEWLQEAFTRVWLGAASHDPTRGQVKPWIYAIAVNTARTELGRKHLRTPHVPLDQPGLALEQGGAADMAARLDDDRRANAMAEALRELPLFHQEVVVLRCSRELSFAEISEITGAPVGTLKSRFHRAVAALREAMAQRRGGRP